eukprot:s8452_g3.t1
MAAMREKVCSKFLSPTYKRCHATCASSSRKSQAIYGLATGEIGWPSTHSSGAVTGIAPTDTGKPMLSRIFQIAPACSPCHENPCGTA